MKGDEVLPAGRTPSARERPRDLRASRDVPGLDAEARHGGHEAQRSALPRLLRLLTPSTRLVSRNDGRGSFLF